MIFASIISPASTIMTSPVESSQLPAYKPAYHLTSGVAVTTTTSKPIAIRIRLAAFRSDVSIPDYTILKIGNKETGKSSAPIHRDQAQDHVVVRPASCGEVHW